MSDAKATKPAKPQTWPADKVVRRDLKTLIPYAKNARLHTPEQIEMIVASIKEWGWTNPVLVAEDGMIIAGHGRVLAAKQLGLAEAPVMVAAGWSEAQVRAYVLADNQLASKSGWDEEMLRFELTGLEELGFDVGLIGFEPADLGALFGEGAADATAPDEFGAYDEGISTEHKCPSCGYVWSGKSGAE